MKKVILIAFASALVGGLVVFGLTKSMHSGQDVLFAPANVAHAKLTNYSNDKTQFPDFRLAAKQSLPSVVHISSMVRANNNRQMGQPFDFQGLPDPFRQFFEQPRGNGGQQRKQEREFMQSSGSGVIISANGYIVTNNHVVDGADKLEVSMNDKRTFNAKVIGTDPSTDLALVKIDATDLPVIQLANSDDLEVGEWVVAVGNPFNLESTVTAGIVSAKGRNINILEDKAPIESYIQTDAAINPGNSGGALVNQDGALVGINSAIASPTGSYAGYGFAIPSNLMAKVIGDLKEYGTVQRGFLGAVIRQVDGHFAKDKGLEVNEYVWVDSLVAGGAAGNAGVKKGDVIEKIDGTPTETSAELLEIVGRHRPGDKLVLTVLRNNKPQEIPVVLKNNMGSTSVVKKESESKTLDQLGADFQSLDKDTAQKLDIDGGVVVNNLRTGRLREETDMRNGFVITDINNHPVKTVDDLVKTLEEAKGGGVMLEGVYDDTPGVYYYAFGM